MIDIIIVGAGPAGLTAAVYARRAGRSVLILERESFGGQIVYSPKVENFPGYLALSGSEIGEKLVDQAIHHGAELAGCFVASLLGRGDALHINDGAAAAAHEMGMGLGAGVEALKAVDHAHADDLAPGAELGQIAVDCGTGHAAAAQLIADPCSRRMLLCLAQTGKDLVALGAVPLNRAHEQHLLN